MVRKRQAEPVPAAAAGRGKRTRNNNSEASEGTPPKRRSRRTGAAVSNGTRNGYADRDDSEETSEGIPAKRSGRVTSNEQNGTANGFNSAYELPSDGGEGKDSIETEIPQIPAGSVTPTRRKRGRPANAVSKGTEDTKANGELSTPRGRKAMGKVTETPYRAAAVVNGETPRWRRNDRSARKKSARALIERVVTGDASDEDEDIAREIYESSEADDVEGLDQDETAEGEEPESAAATPSRKPRGRAKGKTTKLRKKSPTPPPVLPPHEMYFAQNRPGASKTSNNSLASLQLLTHEEYFSILHDYKDPHEEDVEFLQSLHAESFPQCAFELSQGFSICLYGFGSKRSLLHRFAKDVYKKITDHTAKKIVIINGYVQKTSIRDILGTIGSAVDPAYKLPAGNPSALLDSVKTLLSSHEVVITIILNSIDAVPLRKYGMQPILAQLASHPHVQLICSADTPDFSLLWDSSLRSAFNFIFHDCTTFAPYTAEIDVVDDVHELLGRKARRVGGKEGVTYVLRSLPENAKNLFSLLVGELLAAADEGVFAGENPGVEYRILYGKAVEEFICSSEMAFRTLLKEFHDHQMITSRKDVLGTELLSIPFRKEELEAILEDLMS